MKHLVDRNLASINGYVALICNYDMMTSFHLWILGELGVKESWTRLFLSGPPTCVMRPIRVGKEGNIFFRKIDDEMGWFDLITKGINEIG